MVVYVRVCAVTLTPPVLGTLEFAKWAHVSAPQATARPVPTCPAAAPQAPPIPAVASTARLLALCVLPRDGARLKCPVSAASRRYVPGRVRGLMAVQGWRHSTAPPPPNAQGLTLAEAKEQAAKRQAELKRQVCGSHVTGSPVLPVCVPAARSPVPCHSLAQALARIGGAAAPLPSSDAAARPKPRPVSRRKSTPAPARRVRVVPGVSAQLRCGRRATALVGLSCCACRTTCCVCDCYCCHCGVRADVPLTPTQAIAQGCRRRRSAASCTFGRRLPPRARALRPRLAGACANACTFFAP